MILTISGEGGGEGKYIEAFAPLFSLKIKIYCRMQQHYVLPSWPAIQDVPWSRRGFDGEEETAQDPDNFHISSAQGAGEGFPGITLTL